MTLRHSACMMYGGSVDPAYIMSIFALPLFLQPTTNKRNAALIQRHMEDVLGVNPSRGLLRFVPTNDEHLASNSNTVAGQVEETEKSQGHSSSAGGDEGSSGLFRRTSLKLSVKVWLAYQHRAAILHWVAAVTFNNQSSNMCSLITVFFEFPPTATLPEWSVDPTGTHTSWKRQRSPSDCARIPSFPYRETRQGPAAAKATRRKATSWA